MNENITPLSCPFCGAAPYVDEYNGKTSLLFRCESGCFFSDWIGFHGITNKTVKTWNRRSEFKEGAVILADKLQAHLDKQGPTLTARVKELEEENTRLRKGIEAVDALIAESHGVYGLHLNGDPAPWSDLQTGGHFEEWLIDFDAAMNKEPT